MSTDQQIESEIQAKGLTAPRITPADIEANIASEHYFTAADGFRLHWLTTDHESHDQRAAVYSVTSSLPVRGYGGACADIDANAGTPQALGLLTFCVLVLRNGHRIVGVNEGPVSAENFDAELARKLARQKAIDQIWPLMGYELRSKLHAMQPTLTGQ